MLVYSQYMQTLVIQNKKVTKHHNDIICSEYWVSDNFDYVVFKPCTSTVTCCFDTVNL